MPEYTVSALPSAESESTALPPTKVRLVSPLVLTDAAAVPAKTTPLPPLASTVIGLMGETMVLAPPVWMMVAGAVTTSRFVPDVSVVTPAARAAETVGVSWSSSGIDEKLCDAIVPSLLQRPCWLHSKTAHRKQHMGNTNAGRTKGFIQRRHCHRRASIPGSLSDFGPLTNALPRSQNRSRRCASREMPILTLCPMAAA
ncbi:MAG: hypothetical protein J0I21_11085 [Alphaproteobacteria bacterium]|nr:hypothetical protein [Alphaproteobacteria bacterium]